MQIILLCGGSGTRLWPLSNEIRSKQFLKLFKKPDGQPESMFQRILRQIRESTLDAEINVATSHSQADFVIAQTSEAISIIIEPCRRDTFPAIALAASFLAKKKHISRDEIIIVMPCDPDTEAGYFEAIDRMANAVEANVAELVLMGIKPTEPSSKFGYIMPSAKHLETVDYFIEKPDKDKATRLIADGALWNGGVFAFRLGYLLDITSKYIEVDKYEEILSNYSKLPRISFDYEVVESAKSVGVIHYFGKWKDLGTWSSFCEELPQPIIGNVRSENNEGTTILNELNVPIISCGCKDLIIAASPDGILVADKKSADTIKASVKDMSLRPMYEERRWGSYRILDLRTLSNGSTVITKVVTLNTNKSTSYQLHLYREKIWTIVEGCGEVVTGEFLRSVVPGDVVVIPSDTKHALRATTSLTLLEVQLCTKLIEDDTVYFEYDW